MHQIRSAIMSGKGPCPDTPISAKRARVQAPGGPSLTAVPVKRQESRLTDHRAEDRQGGIDESTRLHFHRRSYDARIINLSSSGAMVESQLEPHIGDRIDIELADGDWGSCIVRWMRGGRIGLEFCGFSLLVGRSETGQFVFSRSDSGQTERAARKSLVWTATLHVDGAMLPVRLHNICAGGAMIDAPEDQEIAGGAEVLLNLAGVGTLPAQVRWAEKGRIGLSFDGAFDPAILSDCARAAQPSPEGTSWLKPAYLETELSPDSPWAARWETLKLSDLM